MTEFETLLVRGFVTFYMNNATRDEVRIFNEALDKFKYLSFYPYGEEVGVTNLMFIAFSNKYEIIKLNDNYSVSNLVADDTKYQFFLASRLATVMDSHYMISTKSIKEYIEPLSIERVDIETYLYKQPVIREVSKDILHENVIQFLYKDEYSDNYKITERIKDFFDNDTRITVNLVHDFEQTVSEHGFDRTYLHRNCTVLFDSEIIGFISQSGREFNNLKRTTRTTNRQAWLKMMQYVESAIGFDEHFIGVKVFDTSDDCDTVLGLPGIFGKLAVYTKEPWKN